MRMLPEAFLCWKVGGKRRDISFLSFLAGIGVSSMNTTLSLPSRLFLCLVVNEPHTTQIFAETLYFELAFVLSFATEIVTHLLSE